MNQKTKLSIEEEIKKSEVRIKERTKEFGSKSAKLESKIIFYTRWAWGFVIAGFALVFFGVYDFLCPIIGSFTLNLLGDFFGGALASVWSLAGLFIIYVAFLGQKQQLLNQQIEIMHSQLEVKYTRLELEGQKHEMIEQNKTLRQQKFDNTFFQLLNSHSVLVNSIDLKTKDKTSTVAEGRDCFNYFYVRLRKEILSKTDPQSIDPNKMTLNRSLDGYYSFFNKNQNDLGHYYRNLYHIFKFVDLSNIENKKTYTNFIRAQLSSYELILIFYNCLSKYGINKFKPLVEEYAVLKNINPELVFDQKHLSKYSNRAYSK